MKTESFGFIDVTVLSGERERCAQIAERYADLFDSKRLYPTARVLRDLAAEIREGIPEKPVSIQPQILKGR